MVVAAEAAAAAEGVSTGGGAGGCALRGMQMKRRAGLGWNCQEATDPAACMLIYTHLSLVAPLGISTTAALKPPHTHHTRTHRTTRSQGSHHQATRYADAGTWLPFTKGLASRRHSMRRLCYNSISPGSIGLVMAGAG